jgi:hypothetical protein
VHTFLVYYVLENKSSIHEDQEGLLTPAFPWKCWKNLWQRVPRHYYLQKEIAKRKRNRPNDKILETSMIKKRKHKKAKRGFTWGGDRMGGH